jgi:hypothetical protein
MGQARRRPIRPSSPIRNTSGPDRALVAYNPGAFCAGPAVWAGGVRAAGVQGGSVGCCAVEILLLGIQGLGRDVWSVVLDSSQAACMSGADEIGNIP